MSLKSNACGLVRGRSDLRSSSRVLRPRQFQEIKEVIKSSHVLPQGARRRRGLGDRSSIRLFRRFVRHEFHDIVSHVMEFLESKVEWIQTDVYPLQLAFGFTESDCADFGAVLRLPEWLLIRMSCWLPTHSFLPETGVRDDTTRRASG
ncbi:hypothetical protein TNCV_4032501 [Trichonephila clavipes]|nr:hypothetical protein TNCV_4032501 [Trichonephila clavipes]